MKIYRLRRVVLVRRLGVRFLLYLLVLLVLVVVLLFFVDFNDELPQRGTVRLLLTILLDKVVKLAVPAMLNSDVVIYVYMYYSILSTRAYTICIYI